MTAPRPHPQFLHELSRDDFDHMLDDLFESRYEFPEDKTVITPLFPISKHMLIHHGKEAMKSCLEAFRRAWKTSWDDWNPEPWGRPISKRRRRHYSEELSHACLEVKYWQHACGAIPMITMNGWQVEDLRDLLFGHDFLELLV